MLMMPERSAICIVGGVGVAALVAGCVSPANDRISEGRGPALGGTMMESFRAESGRAGSVGAEVDRGEVFAPQSRSRMTLDRSAWPRTTVLVPVDGTAHRPTLQRSVVVANVTPRQRGEYPTIDSALDLTKGSADAQTAEAAVQPVRAVGDFVLLPFRMIAQPPWTTRWSPDQAYSRGWAMPRDVESAVRPVPANP